MILVLYLLGIGFIPKCLALLDSNTLQLIYVIFFLYVLCISSLFKMRMILQSSLLFFYLVWCLPQNQNRNIYTYNFAFHCGLVRAESFQLCMVKPTGRKPAFNYNHLGTPENKNTSSAPVLIQLIPSDFPVSLTMCQFILVTNRQGTKNPVLSV